MLRPTMAARQGMIVLAGGRSRRMGRDKAWLTVGDEPALLRVVRAGLRAEVEVVVVGTAGRPLPPLPAPVQRVDDPAERAFEGPLSGLSVGLDHLAARGVQWSCFAACDALLMSAAHVRFVLEAVRRSDRPAVVPVSGPFEDGSSQLHPLCAAVQVEPAATRARELLAAGRRAARDLLHALRAEWIAVSDLPEPRVIEGSNTPDQWQQAVAWLRDRGRLRGPGEDVE